MNHRIEGKRLVAAGVALALLSAAPHATAQSSPAVAAFVTSANALSTAVGTFSTSVQQLNGDLIYVQGKLALPGKLASDLTQLDTLLDSSKTLLNAASLVPDLQSATSVMIDGINTTQPPVQSAQAAATNFDNGLKPIDDPVNALQGTVNTLAGDIGRFQQGLAGYVNGVTRVQQCIAGQPAAARQKLQDALDKLAGASTASIANVNRALGATAGTVTTLTQTVEGNLHPAFDPINAIESAIAGLSTSLQGVEGPLKDIGRLLTESFSVSFPYPNPDKTHWFRISHYTLRIKMTTILNGAEKIEQEIEHILSGFLYKVAKLFGLERLINDLVSQADKATKKVIDTLHLDFTVKIPGLDGFQGDLDNVTAKFKAAVPGLALDPSPLNAQIVALQADYSGLSQFNASCPQSGAAPAPTPVPAPIHLPLPPFPSGPGTGPWVPHLPPGPIWPSPPGGGPLGR